MSPNLPQGPFTRPLSTPPIGAKPDTGGRMFTRLFWKDTAERAVSTAAQSAILVFGGDIFFDALTADYVTVGGAALGGAILAVLKALAASQVGTPQTASLLPAYKPRHRAG